MTDKAYRLISLLRDGSNMVRNKILDAENFIILRYDIIHHEYAHGIVFSVSQATPDFFEQTLAILDHGAPLPSRYDEKGNKKSVYDLNYIDWLENMLKELGRER